MRFCAAARSIAARAGAPWPFLASARDGWGRESESESDADADADDESDESDDVDARRSSSSLASSSEDVEDDGAVDGEDASSRARRRRYSRDSGRFETRRRREGARGDDRGGITGVSVARDRVYARAGVRDGRGDDGGPRAEDEDEDEDEDARATDCSTRRSLWNDARAFDADVVDAARSLRSAETRGRGDASGGFTVTFRAGAVRDFVDAVARDAFGGLTSASDYSAVSREGRTAVMYGTSREVDDAREIEVAFIHPWDGDASRVAAWLANRAASDRGGVARGMGARDGESRGESVPGRRASVQGRGEGAKGARGERVHGGGRRRERARTGGDGVLRRRRETRRGIFSQRRRRDVTRRGRLYSRCIVVMMY